MTFIAGICIGVLLTIGTSLLIAGSNNILDEGDENYYN